MGTAPFEIDTPTSTDGAARRRRPVRATVVALLLTLSVFAGQAAVSPPDARAEILRYVNASEVCRHVNGGGSVASFYAWSPHALYCYSWSIPWGVNFQGTLRWSHVDQYCKHHWGRDAYPTISGGGWPVDDWRCADWNW